MESRITCRCVCRIVKGVQCSFDRVVLAVRGASGKKRPGSAAACPRGHAVFNAGTLKFRHTAFPPKLQHRN